MDISSVTGTSNIGGISQPIIGQRKIEQDIRLKDGEVNLLGGMMEDQTHQSAHRNSWTFADPDSEISVFTDQHGPRNTETVFVLIPHIVRAPDFNDLNERELSVGTANAIELRRRPTPPPAAPVPTAQPASSAMTATPAASPAAPPVAQTPPQPPAGASFGFDPASVTQKAGATFAVNVLLSGAQNVYSVPMQVTYDPKTLQVVNVSNGAFLSQDGQPVALVQPRKDDNSGVLQITATRPPGASGCQRPRLRRDLNVPGESRRTVDADHLERRRSGSRHASDAGHRSGGDRHGSVMRRFAVWVRKNNSDLAMIPMKSTLPPNRKSVARLHPHRVDRRHHYLVILTSLAIPLARVTIKREKERELRHDLWEMRDAIDRYKDAADRGAFQIKVGSEGYPPDLDTLVKGVDVGGKKVRFLRRIPVDPMTGSTEWGMRSMQDDPDSDSWGGQNVFDVFTKSAGHRTGRHEI